MTVLELKEILKDLPDDLEIEVYVGTCNEGTITEVITLSNWIPNQYIGEDKLLIKAI